MLVQFQYYQPNRKLPFAIANTTSMDLSNTGKPCNENILSIWKVLHGNFHQNDSYIETRISKISKQWYRKSVIMTPHIEISISKILNLQPSSTITDNSMHCAIILWFFLGSKDDNESSSHKLKNTKAFYFLLEMSFKKEDRPLKSIEVWPCAWRTYCTYQSSGQNGRRHHKNKCWYRVKGLQSTE